MGYRLLLLIPLSPILCIVVIPMWIYERLFLNEQELVDDEPRAPQVCYLVWRGFQRGIVLLTSVLDWPLCGIHFFHWVSLFALVLSTELVKAVKAQTLDPIFRIVVPAVYLAWNSRIYRSLPQDTKYIRVLRIHHGHSSCDLRTNLDILDLENDHKAYDALSYAWGGHIMLRRLIWVNNRRFLVSHSLHNALKELRRDDQDRYLWIDAICINQSDFSEKGHQVSLMRSIYGAAQGTIIWLGKATIETKSAFESFESIALTEPTLTNDNIALTANWSPSLQHLVRKRWWSRMWVVQEVVVAKQVSVRSGPHEIAWDLMSVCLRRLSKSFSNAMDFAAIQFLDLVAELKEQNTERSRGLVSLAWDLRGRSASNARDKLLGLAGLVESTSASLPRDPYSRTPDEFFACFSALHIMTSGSLALMALAEDLPTLRNSWVLNWARFGLSNKRNRNSSKLQKKVVSVIPLLLHSKELLWTGGLTKPIGAGTLSDYTAAQSLPARCREGKPPWKSNFLTGWQEDRIAKTASFYLDSMLHVASTIRSWEKFAGGPWIDLSDSRRRRFINTLFAGKWQGSLPEEWPEMLEQWYLSKVHNPDEGAEHVPALQSIDIEMDTTLLPEGGSNEYQLEHLFVACCVRRNFFVTERGRFGLGPANIGGNELICVLLGSDVPLVLWKRFRKGYRFKGQAYVEDIMYYRGNLGEDIERERVPIQEFEIF
ncbi:uncharacterized protein KY384_006274 [Bacidia gigantensis]|uniref:uncharacterized protein n=1 Tax=Bacidia gigantensis TaxID=2732470 RepID=UPI001D04EC9E|nr:uncharacterized protein KY384_006274 [Bacidia gigantensis]KAG8528587.1 hypothetical protein KY384_006274 [Bacidia gigantensis]